MKGRPGKTIHTGFGDEPAVPVIDGKLCRKCGLCIRACKSFTIIGEDKTPRVSPDNGLGCFACGQCMAVCPSGAVTVTGRRLSPGDCFRLPSKSERATPEGLEKLLSARRSVRDFADRTVEPAVIERVLAISSSAPMGLPPSDVGVVVANGRDRVQELAGDIVKVFEKWRSFFNPAVMTLMRPFMNRYEAETMKSFLLPALGYITESRAEGTDLLFYDAPCVLLFHQSPYADPADGQIACTYAMIAAESLGLGTCMIGTVSYAINREKKIKARWKIPQENKAALALILGYPAFKYTKGLRRDFSSVVYT